MFRVFKGKQGESGRRWDSDLIGICILKSHTGDSNTIPGLEMTSQRHIFPKLIRLLSVLIDTVSVHHLRVDTSLAHETKDASS